jgi:carboxyl-terminal processing protease
MPTWVVLATAVGASACGTTSPSTAFSASTYLNEMVDVMEANSINRATIDWTSVRSTVVGQGNGATSVSGVFPAIATALRLLAEGHSYYRSASGTYVYNPLFPQNCNAAAVPNPTVPATIGYIRVPTYSGSNNGLAERIQGQIREADSASLAGWIIDVRGNAGGNFWAMLAGIGPVLGDGTEGYFISADNQPEAITYIGGMCADGDGLTCAVPNPYQVAQSNPRVAVLTDAVTASAGELVVVCFLNRAGARVFGTPTCGVPTGNATYVLSDSAQLYLNVAVSADRTLKRYNSPLIPDEVISDPTALVTRAIAWLSGQ